MDTSTLLDIPQAIISRYNKIGTAKSVDPVFSPTNGVDSETFAHALEPQPNDDPNAPVGVYIHLPFCPVRCLDCNNNTSIAHDPAAIDRYLNVLEREVALTAATAGSGRQVQQLHIGGGSPNYLSDRQLVRLMSILDRYFKINAETETSLDANPNNASLSQLTLLHGLGFRSISFSVRDLDPGVQLAIGRLNSLDKVRDVFDNARDVGFETISTDLVYGLPRQTPRSIERTVRNLLDLSPSRLCCYAFTRATKERVHQRAIDPKDVPSLADKMSLFNDIVQGLSSDYVWISLDSFAKPDDALSKAQAQHRLRKNWIGYTQLPPSDLHGFGTNAISDFHGYCVQNHLQISSWQSAVSHGQFPIRGGVKLTGKDRQRRDAITELMCNMELRDYAALFDSSDNQPSSWVNYARDGLLAIDGEHMTITPQGRYLLHELLNEATQGPSLLTPGPSFS